MNTKVETTLVEELNKLKNDGYTHDFEIRKGSIFCLNEKKEFVPDEFEVKATFRFEGMTNPGDSSILYAVETKCGMKGSFVENYSIDATNLTQQMREKLQYKMPEGHVRPEDI
jgi:hypothetical protein